MAKLVNLARMTTATTGTGTITLGAAVPGYLTFAQAGVVNGDVVSYGIKDGSNSEVGVGTYTSGGTTLTRSARRSTNSNSAIALSGMADVFITPLAEDIYVNSNILGAVSQSSGVPTGAVIEYGTNANGEYVRLADGTQLVWLQVALPSGAINTNGSVSRILPATFANANIKAMYAPAGAQGGGSQVSTSEVYRNSVWVNNSPSSTSLNTFRYATAQTTNVDFAMIIVGRWL